MAWDKTIRQHIRTARAEGAWDLLRAVLEASDQEPGHECQALEWVRRLYADPTAFNDFIRDSQAARER